MTKTIIAETSEHTAFLTVSDRPEIDGLVTVHRKSRGMIIPVGKTGRWEGGIILGSDVNCGVLVRLEQDLRAQTGTP